MSFLNTIRVFGTYIEQPQVIRNVGKWTGFVGGLGGVSALAGADIYNAPPDQRQNVMVRDALVLGSTALGTYAAARKFMPLPTTKEAKGAVENYIDELCEHLAQSPNRPAAFDKLSAELQALKGSAKLKVDDYRKIIKTINEHLKPEEAKKLLQEIFEPEEKYHGFKEMLKEMWQKGNPAKGEDEGELRKMMSFFVVGGLSVLSGLFGGIAANKINGVKDCDSTVNMVKEGIFQFVANIALCAVGASIALMGMAPFQSQLSKMGWAGRGLKTLGVAVGLSLGIFGGGVIANKLGTNVVNPLCDKWQGKTPQPQTDPNQGKRKIEFWDLILHLDDVPTALALAGMKIVEPFIPLFFGFSGYRTGIGYRNNKPDQAAPAPRENPEKLPPYQNAFNPVSAPMPAPASPFGNYSAYPSMPQNLPFATPFPMNQAQPYSPFIVQS